MGVVAVLGIMGIIGEAIAESGDAPKEQPVAQVEKKEEVKKVSVVDKVNKVFDGMDKGFKSTLASTSVGGLQGDIVGVEADGDDGVVVKVSTYFTKSGDEEDGGKNIAQKIYSNICLDVPELKTLYVTSTTSGLDSRSVYQSSVSACRS